MMLSNGQGILLKCSNLLIGLMDGTVGSFSFSLC